METWKILLITVASAVVLGCILGVIIGKHQAKKARGDYKPLLSLKEKIIYFLCFAVGTGCVLLGIFYTFPSSSPNIVNSIDMGGVLSDEEGVMAFSPDKEGALDGIILEDGEALSGEDEEDEDASLEDSEEASEESDSETAATTNPGTADTGTATYNATPRVQISGDRGTAVIVRGG